MSDVDESATLPDLRKYTLSSTLYGGSSLASAGSDGRVIISMDP